MPEMIVVQVAGENLGIPVSAVRHVLGPQTVYPVPLAHPAIAGVLNMRGRIITAVDLAHRLGLARSESATASSSVVVDWKGEPYALLVDRVDDILELAEPAIDPRELASFVPSWHALARNLYGTRSGVLVELDIDRLLTLVPAREAA